MKAVPLHPTTEKPLAANHVNLHAAKHVESHSIKDSVVFGILVSLPGFIILGLLIGNDRVPGSYYTYGLSTFFWPTVAMIALGTAVGGSLGFVFGSIAHASDPVPETANAVEAAPEKKGHSIGLRLHSHRH